LLVLNSLINNSENGGDNMLAKKNCFSFMHLQNQFAKTMAQWHDFQCLRFGHWLTLCTPNIQLLVVT